MGQKILLVDDDELTAEFMKLYLLDEGYEVTSVNSLRAALTALAEIIPDIVITDIQLGDGSGIELAEKAKAQGVKKVLGVSGYSGSQLEQMNKDTKNLDHVLVKPIEFVDLAAALSGSY